MKSKKDMIAFLSGHFRYSTMNSWNGSGSYAANVKIGGGRRKELQNLPDNAYEMLEMEEAFDGVNMEIAEFNSRHNYQYQIGFNGRSGGYMVLYRGGADDKLIVDFKPGEERTYSDRLRRWVDIKEAKAAGWIGKTYKDVHVMTGQSIGSSDPAEYEDMELYSLREEVKLVKDFDKTVAACCRAFADFCRGNEVEEVEIMVPKTVKRIKGAKTMKLYYHKTDGGAEYLFDTFIKWKHNGKSGKEGVINDKTKIVVRLDGKQPELTIRGK